MSESEVKLDEPCCSKSIQENIDNDSNKTRNKRRIESSNEGSKKKSNKKKDTVSLQIRQCKKLLYHLRSAKEHMEYAQYFYYPVDPVAYQCPDYYDVIKNPMDLSTMQEKMNKEQYNTPEEFEVDIRLIIDNCLLYNGPEHEIVPFVNKFRDAFETRFQKIMNPKPRYSNIAPTESGISYRKSSRSFIFIPDDEETLVKEIAKTQKYLAKLYEKHKSILNQHDVKPESEVTKPKKRVRKKSSVKNPKKNAKKEVNDKAMQNEADLIAQRNLSSSSDDEDNQIPMSYDEKRELVLDINKLPGNKIEEISQVVKDLDPDCFIKIEDDNFELNFADCKTKTLRALQKLTNDFFRPKPARAVPLPRKEKLEKNRKLVEELKVDLENQKKDCETKLATVENRLAGFIHKKVKSPEPVQTQTALSSTSSGTSSSSSSSSSTSSDSSSDSEYKG